MPRVKSNVARLKRKNKVMKLAKGYFGGRSKLWKAAKESVERAQKYAYRDRRRKKGDFRRLWIIRINAAARLHPHSPARAQARPCLPQGGRGRRECPETRLRNRVRSPGARAEARQRRRVRPGPHHARPRVLAGRPSSGHAGRRRNLRDLP